MSRQHARDQTAESMGDYRPSSVHRREPDDRTSASTYAQPRQDLVKPSPHQERLPPPSSRGPVQHGNIGQYGENMPAVAESKGIKKHKPMQSTMRGSADPREQQENAGSRKPGLFKSIRSTAGSFFYPEGDYHQDEGMPGAYSDHKYRAPSREQELMGEVDYLKRDSDNKGRQIGELQAELQKAQALSNSVKLSADRMQLALDNKDVFFGVQLSDENILSRFQHLFGQIKTWSTALSGTSPPEVHVDKVQGLLQSIVPGSSTEFIINKTFASPKKRRQALRGCVAQILCHSVFRATDRDFQSASCDVWLPADRVCHAFADLEDCLAYTDRSKISLRQLHDWRALTAELLSKVEQGHEAEQWRNKYLGGIFEPLMTFASQWVAPEAHEDLWKSLMLICADAVEFAQVLRRQRASWSVRTLLATVARGQPADQKADRAVLFDGHVLKDFDDEGGMVVDDGKTASKRVDIFLEPAVFKRGDANGDGFDRESCLLKALVTCQV